MIKFSLKLTAFLVLLLSTVAHAGLIKSELTEANYVTIGDLDWTWASSENESYSGNTIYTPDSIIGLADWDRKGWRHATVLELSNFISNIDSTLFSYQNANGTTLYKNSLLFWNTDLLDVDYADAVNIDNGLIETFLVGNGGDSSWGYETFYVRNTPSQVPEPSTIMIFAIALIALSLRKRAIK